MRSRSIALFACLFLLAGAACGGGEEDSPSDAAESSAPGEETSPSPASGMESAGTAESKSGDFTVSIPEGWVSEAPNETSEMYLLNEATVGMELGILSGPLAGGAPALTEYLQGQLDQVSAFTNVTEVTDLTPLDYPVAESPATYFDWYFRADLGGTETDMVERRVAFEQSGRLYEMKLQSPAEFADEAFEALDHVLQSWAFGG